jgi:hypothetical protein
VPFLFWLPNLFGQALGPHGGAVSWIPKPTPRFVYDCLAGVYSTPKLAKPLLVGGALASLWLVRERRRVIAVLLIILAGQPALLLVGSLIQPMLLVRTLLWPTALFFVLLALGIARLRARALQLGAIGALTALQLYQHLPEFTSPDTPEIMAAAARAIEERATPQDVVVAIPDSLHIDLIYAWRGNAARGIPRYFGSYGDEHDQIAPWLRGQEIARADLLGIARDRSRSGGAVWLVTEAQPLFPIPADQTPAPLIERLQREGWTLLTSQHDNIIVTRISCGDASCMGP